VEVGLSAPILAVKALVAKGMSFSLPYYLYGK
jgi:hypothetical protein